MLNFYLGELCSPHESARDSAKGNASRPDSASSLPLPCHHDGSQPVSRGLLVFEKQTNPNISHI